MKTCIHIPARAGPWDIINFFVLSGNLDFSKRIRHDSNGKISLEMFPQVIQYIALVLS